MKKNRVKFNPIGEKVLVQVHPFETKVNGIYRVDHLQENQKERLSLLITPRLLI